MMEKRENILNDVIAYGDKISLFLQRTSTIEQYQADEQTRLAIERCFGIIWKASQNLKRKFGIQLTLYPAIVHLRENLIRRYDEIESETVYNFAKIEIPSIVLEARELLRNKTCE